MKNVKFYSVLPILVLMGVALLSSSKVNSFKDKETSMELVQTNIDGKGTKLTIIFEPGKYHNHPTMAVWVEDVDGNYKQTLYVTKSLATSIFAHGESGKESWKSEPGVVRRPAALPYYLHKRNIKAPDNTYLPTPENPVPDAYTGATPIAGFNLETQTDTLLSGKFVLLFEVNQPWDWNEYWNNTLYPDDFNYKTSCQPAIVYAVTIDLNNKMEYYSLNPIGHSHYSGTDGKLYTDLTTLSTALQIFEKITITVK